MATVMADKTQLEGADKQFGYRFGCDGLMSIDEACKFLGGVSRHTLARRADAGLIRTGRQSDRGSGRTVFCRRSVEEYAASLES